MAAGMDMTAGPGEALGSSEEFVAFQARLSRAAKVDRPVLIVGERGTGKELAVQRLHYLSSRWGEPLIALNCAALAPSLLESELFGHEAGAFTGAARKRSGRFEAADGGSLFLDEIGLIPLEAQEKILRVVEYGVFERVGGEKPVSVDVRIIGATNADLPKMAEAGRFKPDLLDRLSFEVLYLPPLRARTGDIVILANHFAARMAREMEGDYIEPPEFSPAALEALANHPWPGNVRELKNVVERAVYRASGGVIEKIVFDPFRSPYEPLPEPEPASAIQPQKEPRPEPAAESEPPSLAEAIKETELAYLRKALAENRFNQRQAAKALNLSYDQIRHLIKKHGGVEKITAGNA